MSTFKITVLPGDGIGPEVVSQAIMVLDKIGEKYNIKFEYTYADIGGIAIDKHGVPLPDETLEICKKSDAVLLGAVGGPKWDTLPGKLRPESGLLAIRAGLKLFANYRPATIWEALKSASPLNERIIGNGIDIMVLRELTGGIYFGEKVRKIDENGLECAYDTMIYNTSEVERISRLAFETAMVRNKKVTSVDKENVLKV